MKVYQPEEIGAELFRTILQVLAIVIFGQVVSLVATSLSRERKRMDSLFEFKRGILGQLNSTYASAKRVRRLLRARGLVFRTDEVPLTLDEHFPEAVAIERDPYDQYLQELVDIQLTIETIGREVVASRFAFRDPRAIEMGLRSMDDYLNGILHEYQFLFSRFRESSQVSLDELVRLRDFLGRYSGSEFERDFILQYAKVLRELREDLLSASRSAVLGSPGGG